jgi:hypothetical protein
VPNVAYFAGAGPCPCGSGKPFNECCLIRSETASPLNALKSYIQSALGKRKFSSIEELNTELDRIMRVRNTTPVEEFSGLSPEQMTRLLYFPFESSHLIEFSTAIKSFAESPFIKLFSFLIQRCNESRGLKATAKGNLPRNLCRDIALEYYGEEEYRERLKYFRIMTEADFMELHTVHIVAGMAGFIKRAGGRFILTKAGKDVAHKSVHGKTILELLKAYTLKFNWGFNDRYPELPIVQNSFLYTLFVLKKYGDIFRPCSFYEDLFIKAYPSAVDEVPETPFSSKEEVVRRCYAVRCLERFACFWGLAQGKIFHIDHTIKNFELKNTSLLDELVRFHIGGH